MGRIGAIRPSLSVDAHGPEGSEDQMHEQAEQRIEDVHDVQDSLYKEDEHGKDRDDQVPIREADRCTQSVTMHHFVGHGC